MEPAQSASEPEDGLAAAFEACRAGTLALVEDLDDSALAHQPHPGFSPIGWHLGHIGYTEALWLIRHAAGEPPPRPEWETLLRADGLPKAARRRLPPREAILEYLDETRARTRRLREAGRLDPRLCRFLLQHESQHDETMTMLRRLAGFDDGAGAEGPPPAGPDAAEDDTLVTVPAGPFRQGGDGEDALDNEGPPRTVELAAFAIERRPASQGRFRRFMEAGGYDDPRWWTPEGWAWRRRTGVRRPRHWRPGADDRPVSGICWYEADAFARFVGRRLPTEAEWEKAAAAGVCAAMFDSVWQWTATPFRPYPGFVAWPYEGYSAAYFDGRHYVLKGGSWATRPWVRRASFRNWYAPGVREIFAGVRCATDA